MTDSGAQTPPANAGGAVSHPEWHPAVNPFIIAITVMIATFMEVLDTSVANVSLPHIAGNLSATIDESTWVLTSYLVSNAVVLPLAGWFSMLFGRKRFYMGCVFLFTTSSLLCGLAPNLETLVLFRVLQGVGGGALQPISQAILVESFPLTKRGTAMAFYGMGVVLAPIIGPTLGGWITDSFSWRWIFLINIPVGILSLLLTSFFIVDPPYLIRKSVKTGLKIDYVGFGLLGVGLGSLQIFLDKGQREDWFESNWMILMAVLAGLSILIGIFWELRQKDPLVELHLLRERNFTLSIGIMFMLGVILYGSLLLLPIFLQTLLGYTAMLSGLVLSPGGVVVLFAMPIVGRLVSRYEARWLILFGIIVTSISLFYMGRFSLEIDFRTAVISRMIQGVGLAFLFVPLNTLAFYFVPREKMSSAAGLINLARNIGGSVGIAIVTTLVARLAQVHQTVLVGHLTPYDPAYTTMLQRATQGLINAGSAPLQAAAQAQGLLYGQLVRQSTMLAFVDAFRWLGFAFIALIPLLFFLKTAKPHRSPAPVAH